MRERIMNFAFGGLAVLCVVAVIIGFVIYNKNDQQAKILSADDVGIQTLLNEHLISARYESKDPTQSYDCTNLDEITSLLNTVKNATFQVTDKPTNPYMMIELVIVETDNGSFSFGIMGDTFAVRLNEERKYYTCNGAYDFIKRLNEIKSC